MFSKTYCLSAYWGRIKTYCLSTYWGRIILQHSALLPACKQTAAAVKQLFIAKERKLDAREKQDKADDDDYQAGTDADSLTNAERRRLQRLLPRNKGVKPPTVERRTIKKVH